MNSLKWLRNMRTKREVIRLETICTYLPRCRGRLLTRWVVRTRVAAGDAMIPPPARLRRSLTVALSVHLSL